MAVPVVSWSTVALACAVSTPTLVETLIPSNIPCKWVLGGYGQVLNCWRVVHWLTSKVRLLGLEQHCSHLLCEQGDVLIQQLLICRDCVDCSCQVLGNSLCLVHVGQRASHGCCSRRVCDCRGVVAQVIAVQHIVHVLGRLDVPLLASRVVQVSPIKLLHICSVHKCLQYGPCLIWHCFPILEFAHQEDPGLEEEVHCVGHQLRLCGQIFCNNCRFLSLLDLMEEHFGGLIWQKVHHEHLVVPQYCRHWLAIQRLQLHKDEMDSHCWVPGQASWGCWRP
jgi:hypothetical protein